MKPEYIIFSFRKNCLTVKYLLYLKPIINGVGNFYVEARTRNMRRTDVVIDYCGQQFVCELKIWHGEERLMDYLDAYHLQTGYMLSFKFN